MQKKMKPVKAWAHVTPTAHMQQFFRSCIYPTRADARRALGGMGKHGFRVARVEIREIVKK